LSSKKREISEQLERGRRSDGERSHAAILDEAAPIGQANGLPPLFVLKHDPAALNVLRSDLSRRFGNDFAVLGESSSEAALVVGPAERSS